MLSGNGSGVESVKVVIDNRSGQTVKATQSSAQINMKDMVINIVLEAVSNNENGINNILKGAVQNG